MRPGPSDEPPPAAEATADVVDSELRPPDPDFRDVFTTGIGSGTATSVLSDSTTSFGFFFSFSFSRSPSLSLSLSLSDFCLEGVDENSRGRCQIGCNKGSGRAGEDCNIEKSKPTDLVTGVVPSRSCIDGRDVYSDRVGSRAVRCHAIAAGRRFASARKDDMSVDGCEQLERRRIKTKEKKWKQD